MRFNWTGPVILTAAMATASLLAGASPVSAEIISITCIETIAGGSEGDPVTKNIRIDTTKLEVTVRQRNDPTIERYSNATGKDKINAANTLAAQIRRDLGIDVEKSVTIADNTIVWTLSQSFKLFRSTYNRATSRLVETMKEQPHESVIKSAQGPPPPHEYICK
jgi:hypothetical protein